MNFSLDERCLGKVCYTSRRDAIKFIKQMLSKGGKKAKSLKGRVVYRCPHCKLFHFGHKFKTKVSKKKRDDDGSTFDRWEAFD